MKLANEVRRRQKRRILSKGIKTGQPGVNAGIGEETRARQTGRSTVIGTTATELHRGGDK